ncbi:YbgA family protein [Litorivivens sp.]|uniref:YbgA family protein n=3 Tax=Litorivivens sp. TaxID=2020868 RepID=UPI003565C513
MNLPQTITLGISSCLLGQEVRFDGGHKNLPFASKELSRHFEFYPVCPEMAVGLGTPRPTLRLVQSAQDTIRVRRSEDNSIDVTDELAAVADKTVTDAPYISGYVVCAKSPSCGMERVPVYKEDGHGLGKIGVGAFAQRLMEKLPLLPVEENGRLNDPLLRENFVMRVIAYRRWQELQSAGISAAGLQEFHRRHKFLLLAHNQSIYRELGPLVADATNDLEASAAEYFARFMGALARPASRSNHTNSLMHMQGFVKEHLDSEERQDLSDQIDKYRTGTLPLLVPLALLERYAKKYDVDYLLDQFYFHPYPEDLKLRYGL